MNSTNVGFNADDDYAMTRRKFSKRDLWPMSSFRGIPAEAERNQTSSVRQTLENWEKKIASIPDRSKGGSIYDGRRSNYSRAIITEQVHDVALNYVQGNVDFDEDNADWMVIPKFRMPKTWGVTTAPLLIVFPPEYPTTPPIGFYLPNTLTSPDGHFYNRTYHDAEEAPTLEGWNWYCCTVNEGGWRPYPARASGEWRNGDNLWTYITLINEILSSED